METLQGPSASELSSVDGRKWRTAYSDPDNEKERRSDSTIWPEAFERMWSNLSRILVWSPDDPKCLPCTLKLFWSKNVSESGLTQHFFHSSEEW